MTDTVASTLEVDPNRPNLKGNCPFCGGTWAGGYPKEYRGATVSQASPVPKVWHSYPECERFTSLRPLTFIREAKRAGARCTQVDGSPLPSTPLGS